MKCDPVTQTDWTFGSTGQKTKGNLPTASNTTRRKT